MAPRREHLNFVLFGEPHGWLDKRQNRGSAPQNSLARHVEFAQQAESAKLDAYFKADFLGFDKHNILNDPSLLTEPLAVASALTAVTKRLGLVVTASTTFFDPYNVARQVATLHNLSGGRAGWNAVTSFKGEVNFGTGDGSSNFGTLTERYERAAEFVEVVAKLWDGWEPTALTYPEQGTPALDVTRVHDTDHVGSHFSVQQPLDVSRLVEDLPVVFQAGASDDGIRFAARFGEAVFVATPDLDHARTYYDRLKGLVAENGRHPDSLRILPGVRIHVGDTEQQALEEYRDVFQQESFYEQRRKFVKREAPFLDLDPLDLDDVIPAEQIPTKEQAEQFLVAHQRRVSRGLLVLDILTAEKDTTVRQLLQRLKGSGHLDVIGTPEQVADVLAEWFTVRASDGFTLHGGSSFDRFTGEVIPLLQKKGLVREEYAATTLRQNLGLDQYHLGRG